MRILPRRLRHGEEATLVEHLEELRARVFVVLIAFGLAFVVTYTFHGTLLEWLNQPLPARLRKPVTFSPLEPFSTSIWVSLWAAFLVTLPIFFWQTWAFFAPALEERHQRSIGVLVAFSAALALAGVAFGYWVVLPAAIHFLTNYDSSHFTILIRARDYYRFAAIVLLAVSIAFEVPVFVLGLVRLRILSAARLRRSWRMGVFVMVLIGVALPGVDPVSTILSTLPLVALYVLSIALASVLEPRWRRTWEDEALGAEPT
jgi:sec-independent protein translocase protein TatC